MRLWGWQHLPFWCQHRRQCIAAEVSAEGPCVSCWWMSWPLCLPSSLISVTLRTRELCCFTEKREVSLMTFPKWRTPTFLRERPLNIYSLKETGCVWTVTAVCQLTFEPKDQIPSISAEAGRAFRHVQAQGVLNERVSLFLGQRAESQVHWMKQSLILNLVTWVCCHIHFHLYKIGILL